VTAPASPSNPTLAIVRTTVVGEIEWVNDVAATLLGISARTCVGGLLLPFFAGDRHLWSDAIRNAVAGDEICGSAVVRPRDRRPIMVFYRVALVSDAGGSSLKWSLAIP
jgi:hypothetical protein